MLREQECNGHVPKEFFWLRWENVICPAIFFEVVAFALQFRLFIFLKIICAIYTSPIHKVRYKEVIMSPFFGFGLTPWGGGEVNSTSQRSFFFFRRFAEKKFGSFGKRSPPKSARNGILVRFWVWVFWFSPLCRVNGEFYHATG